MKQEKNFYSSSANLDEQPSSTTVDSKNRLVYFFRSKGFKLIILAIGFALLITVYLLANRGSNEKEATSQKLGSNFNAPEVEVLDAAGNMRVAQHLTNYIRSKGYDVVEMKKHSEGVEDRSFIIDRVGKLDDAKRLATELGVPQDKVFQKVDTKLFIDITVVIGKDFRTLKAFQATTERN